MVQMAIEKDFLTTSFTVLQDQPMDMLLGLDMLRRHQVRSAYLALIPFTCYHSLKRVSITVYYRP